MPPTSPSSRPCHILYVEDDDALRQSIAFILTQQGYTPIQAGTGRQALEEAIRQRPDLILLDLSLPDIDGFDLCSRLAQRLGPDLPPLVMLTGRTQTDSVVAGLERYADDYITKPADPAVLLARIHAVLRRTGGAGGRRDRDSLMDFGRLRVDPASREACLDGGPLPLTRSEFDLLLLLASRPGRVFTREQILERLRAGECDLTDRVVDFQVAGLRRKLGPLAGAVVTVRGIGYKFQPA